MLRGPLLTFALVAGTLALFAVASEPTGSLTVEYRVPYQGKGEPTLNIYRPENMRGPAPAVVAVHGGTWRHGDGGKMHRFAQEIARSGFVVFKVRYTYATKKRGAWPRQLDDVQEAVRWIRANAERLEVDRRRIGAFGSSSGAHIVGLLATKARGGLERGARVRAAVTWSAGFDFLRLRRHPISGPIHFFLGCKKSKCGRKLRKASPIRHVSRDDPPMLIMNARDELMPLAQPRRMASKLRSKGVDARLTFVSGNRHAAKNARKQLPITIDYLREQLAVP